MRGAACTRWCAHTSRCGHRTNFRRSWLVVLIADVPDELLEQILERHDAGEAAGWIADDREVSPPAQHLEQRVVAAGTHRDVRHRAEPNAFALGILEYVEGVNHSDDVVERVAINRHATVARLGDSQRALGTPDA